MARSKRPMSRRCLTRGFIAGSAHRLCVGKPEDHPFFAGQTRLTFARCGIIDPTSLADYAAHDGLARPRPRNRHWTCRDHNGSDQIGASLGAAGRLSDRIKWKTVADAPS